MKNLKLSFDPKTLFDWNHFEYLNYSIFKNLKFNFKKNYLEQL